MAFLREYELFEPVLIKYFYLDSSDKVPSLIIRFDMSTGNFSVQNKRPFWVTSSIVSQEISRLYFLLGNPHWKSIVNTCSTAHRYIDEKLF